MKTKEKIKFAVDVDDVLRSLLCNMVDIYNEEFNEHLTCEDVLEYEVDKSFPKAKENYGSSVQWFFSKNSEKLFKYGEPIEGSVTAINKLSEYGDVFIVTKQSGLLNKIYALEWLEKFGVKYNAVCFVEDKAIVKCDYLIDDYHENFRNVQCTTAVLINAPYNRNITDKYIKKISECKNIYRFDSISDFVEYFENHINK